MPVQTMSRSFDGPVPYFSSPFGSDPHLDRLTESPVSEGKPGLADDTRISSSHSYPDDSPPSSNSEAHHYSHQPRSSVSTVASESPECSPSATISPTDSTANSEITPGTSPDTPASMHSLSFLALRQPREVPGSAPLAADSEFYRPAPPAKKARNLKNLAVNTSSAFATTRKATTASFPIEVSPVANSPTLAVSPAFVKPHPAPKRKPSNLGLTLMTPATGSFPVPQPFANVPPTPNLVRPTMLRHFQSSPSLPTFASARLPERPLKLSQHPLRRSTPFSVDDAPSEKDEIISEDARNFDESESRVASPNAYPDGPVCIYDPTVYLYSEPTAEEASAFDVVFNVASEVKNPFLDQRSNVQSSIAQTSLNPAKPLPLYRHIPWEHNTDIVPDLFNLVKEIDDYSRKGKKILIHCQCGVSRSASLIVAYGLYKNPLLSVQEAYDTVKRKSQWIGPNMNLIMQLQEFRTDLLKKSRGSASGDGLFQFYPPNDLRSAKLSFKDAGVPQTAPLRAEPNFEEQAGPETPIPVSPGPSSAPSEFNRNSNAEFVDEPEVLPSTNDEARSDSAARVDEKPSSLQIQTVFPQSSYALAARDDLDLPVRPKTVIPATLEPAPASPRSTEFAMTTIVPSNDQDTFGLTSPRTTMFNTELPHRQLRGDTAPEIRALIQQPELERTAATAQDLDITPTAATSSFTSLHDARYAAAPLSTQAAPESDLSDALMSPRAFEFTNPFHGALPPPPLHPVSNSAGGDPRSPPQKGSSPVFRNIFEVL